MSNFDANIISFVDRIRNDLAIYLSANEQGELESLEILQVLDRAFSRVVFLQAETSAGPRKLVVKKVIHDPINIAVTKRENQAVVEYEVLQRLYSKFQQVKGCAVPRPILVVPDLEAFVMESVTGRSLSEELHHARYWATASQFRRLRNYYYLCGRWLKYFQDFTERQSAGAEVFADLLERCDLRLKLIEELKDPRCPNNLRQQTLDFLHKQVSHTGEGDVSISGRHGDFGHWNIVVNHHGVVVLDFLGYAKESILYDMLKILISLEFWKMHPAYSQYRLDSLKKSLLDGYGDLDPQPLQVATICEAYHRVALIYASLSNPGSRWDKRWTKRRALQENLQALEHLKNGKTIWRGTIVQ